MNRRDLVRAVAAETGQETKSIDSALNDFADHWNYGMKRLVKKVDMTGEAILAAGQRYAAVEDALSAPIQALP